MGTVQLIVGLGNPGPSYLETRHNAGQIFVEKLAREAGISLAPEKKFHGTTGAGKIGGHEIRLLIPTTFMNRSGLAVAAISNFYRIPLAAILVAHDELDFAPGTVRVKTGGGHGGHNGLRDIITACGGNDFHRLRIGIGHPGSPSEVSGYVLRKAPANEHEKIMATIDEAIRHLPAMVNGEWPAVMQKLHSFQAN